MRQSGVAAQLAAQQPLPKPKPPVQHEMAPRGRRHVLPITPELPLQEQRRLQRLEKDEQAAAVAGVTPAPPQQSPPCAPDSEGNCGSMTGSTLVVDRDEYGKEHQPPQRPLPLQPQPAHGAYPTVPLRPARPAPRRGGRPRLGSAHGTGGALGQGPPRPRRWQPDLPHAAGFAHVGAAILRDGGGGGRDSSCGQGHEALQRNTPAFEAAVARQLQTMHQLQGHHPDATSDPMRKATRAAYAAADANRARCERGQVAMSMFGLAAQPPPQRALMDPELARELAEGRRYVRAQLANENVFMR